jgi:hypothetical protein
MLHTKIGQSISLKYLLRFAVVEGNFQRLEPLELRERQI